MVELSNASACDACAHDLFAWLVHVAQRSPPRSCPAYTGEHRPSEFLAPPRSSGSAAFAAWPGSRVQVHALVRKLPELRVLVLDRCQKLTPEGEYDASGRATTSSALPPCRRRAVPAARGA